MHCVYIQGLPACLYNVSIINKVYTEFGLLIAVFYYVYYYFVKITCGQWRKDVFCPPGGCIL